MTHAIDFAAVTPAIAMLELRHAAVMHVVGRPEQLPSLLSEAFAATMQQVAASGAQVAGPPFARYLALGEQMEAEAGFPYVGTLVPTDRVHDAILPGGRAVLTTHVGPYDEIAGAWQRLDAWIREQGLEASSPPWESYLTGPDDPGPPVTQIVFPIR
jgi:effector-binding domain-containing protein